MPLRISSNQDSCRGFAQQESLICYVNPRAAAGRRADHVFPAVPIRQSVLWLPLALRYHLAYDKFLVRDVRQVFADRGRVLAPPSQETGGDSGGPLEMICNTAPFDITHHPAMAIPCGMSEGLPVSMMLVGKHFDESTIYRAAHAFEQGSKWKSM